MTKLEFLLLVISISLFCFLVMPRNQGETPSEYCQENTCEDAYDSPY